jgi:hypothetical protein
MSATEARGSQPVYVYGVVASAATPPLATAGIADEPLELVEHEDLAAVVSRFPGEDFRVRRRDLLAHLRAIEEVFARRTIAPCPFGTVLPSVETVRAQLLEPRADELRQLLQRLEGHVQMNVKAEYDEDAVLRQVVADDPEVARGRERAKALGDAGYYENIRLGELIAARIAARKARDAAEIEERLVARASAAETEATDRSELLVFKGSFLVGREALDGFDAALDGLARESGYIRFQAMGPLPPVDFAALERGVGSWG